MQGFLLLWWILQNVDLTWCDSCVLVQDYVCKEIPTSYPPDLNSVVLFVNNVGEINSTVFNYTNLASVTSLTMTKSGITFIAPGAFDKFRLLQNLNLHDNDLSEVTSAWFTHKEDLKNLDLSNNSITALSDEAFSGLSGLSSVNLTQNQIHTITSSSFHSLGKLRELDLSYNKLKHLSVHTLLPLNGTRIRLRGNPWDCSCSVIEFAEYLQELKVASLLEKHMEVLCASPADQSGVHVWNVTKCLTSTTGVPEQNGHTLLPTSTKPGTINPVTLISLMVVLCALVLVICVLSVLYHRKRQQKHMSVRPSPEDPEATRPQTEHADALESSKKPDLVVPELKTLQSNNRNEVLLRLGQTGRESEKITHMYQMYSTGIYQPREASSRVQSAGPVLSRTEVFGRQSKAKGEDQVDPGETLVKDEEPYAEWAEGEREQIKDGHYEVKRCMTPAKTEQGESGRNEEEEQLRTIRMHRKHSEKFQVEDDKNEEDGGGDELNTTLEKGKKFEKNLMGGENTDDNFEEHSQEFLPSDDKDDAVLDEVKDNVSSTLTGQQTPRQDGDDASQRLDDAENIPYLTIGPDPETQIQKAEQTPSEASTQPESSRPIRRVLTWPPTAAQWKKQLAQSHQVLSVFPQFIFFTECKYQINTFPFSMSSASPECMPQPSGHGVVSGSGSPTFLLHKSARENMTAIQNLEPSEEISESVVQSCIQDLLNAAEDYGQATELQSDVINSHHLNSEAQYEAVGSDPLSTEIHFKADDERSVNAKVDPENTKRIKTSDQAPKSEQMGTESQRRSKRKEKEGGKLLRKEAQKDRVQSGSGSAAPPSGASPSDDNLLEDNEYAFIDLLHEVVENQGRWTRERWRQSHKNRKYNRLGKSQ